MSSKMTKNIFIGCTIIGLSILGYGLLEYKFKTDQLTKEQQYKLEVLNKESLDISNREKRYINCKKAAESDYNSYWNAQCKVAGRDKTTESCSLPKYIADDVEDRRQKAIDNCVKLYSAGK